MASQIQQLLNNILNAVYGRDVRSSIHDAIAICYDDVSNAKTIADDATESVTIAIENATSAALNANNAASGANTAASYANSKGSEASVAAIAANEAKAQADEARDAAIIAKNNADASTLSANNAANSANEAATAAITATTNANSAKDAANAAATSANNAATAATTAAGTANAAANLANTAASNADAKADLANAAANLANTAASSADIATRKAETATTAAITATTNANSAKDAANTAASSAINAATTATTAAGNANTAAADANTMIASMEQKISDCQDTISDAIAAKNNATTAATSANRAAGKADAAADSIENMTVTSEDAPPSTTATAIITDVSGHKNIHFVLRQGKQGASFTIKGSAYATVADLQNGVSNPEIGDQYNVGNRPPFNVYRWTGSVWEDQGTIGSNVIDITSDEIDAIRNGRDVDPDNKVLGIVGLEYLLNDVLNSLFNEKVDKVTGKGLSTNDFTTVYKNTVDDLSSQVSTLSANKVDKVTGKGLSTNDFTTALKNKLDTIESEANKIVVDNGLSDASTNPVQNKVIYTALNDKVDKVTGKGLSTNDFTTAYKNTVDDLSSQVSTLSANKVDKVTGKGLSTNDFTTAYKNTVDDLSSQVSTLSANKVDKVTGKGLSTNDFTAAYKTKVDGIEEGATNTIVDSALSLSSTNPVQNKVIAEAINNAGGSIKFINTTVSVYNWIEEDTPTFFNYPYKATIACSNVTSSMYVAVAFNPSDAASGIYSPIAESGNDCVSIWSNEIPSSNIVIPTIIAFK